MSGYTVTINSINRGTDGTMFGHAWIVITDPSGNQSSYGYGPENNKYPFSQEGGVSMDDNIQHPNSEFSRTYEITSDQAQRIQNFAEHVRTNLGPYDLVGRNCVRLLYTLWKRAA